MPHSPALASRPCRLCRPPTRANAAALRQGFTLVELLVVIGIIGILAAISVPIVMQSLAKARNSAIKAEIDMLHMAIMNYKNEYGSFPPSAAVINGSDRATRHIQRLFPRVANAYQQASCLPFQNGATTSPLTGATEVTPDTAIVAWLSGFTNDPTAPVLSGTSFSFNGALTPPLISFSGTRDRKRLYDFDRSRLTADFHYHPPRKPDAFFVYIDKSQYGAIGSGVSLPMFGFYHACRRPTSANPTNFADTTQIPFNENSFQILSAGQDETWGTDDDLSNFWPGTRREFLDSPQ